MDLLVRGRQIPDSTSHRQGQQPYFSRHAFTWNRWPVILPMQGTIEHPPAYTPPSQSEKPLRRYLSRTKRLVADMDPSDYARQSASTSLHPFARSDSQCQGNG